MGSPHHNWQALLFCRWTYENSMRRVVSCFLARRACHSICHNGRNLWKPCQISTQLFRNKVVSQDTKKLNQVCHKVASLYGSSRDLKSLLRQSSHVKQSHVKHHMSSITCAFLSLIEPALQLLQRVFHLNCCASHCMASLKEAISQQRCCLTLAAKLV